MERKRLYAVLSSGLLATSLILSGGTALAQPLTTQPPPVQLQPPIPQVQPVPPSIEKKPVQPAGAVEKKPAKPAETMGKKLAPRLNCGLGWKQVGEMSCEAVKPVLQCPPGTNYFEGKFLVGCR